MNRKKLLIVAVFSLILALAVAGTAWAITDGGPDNNEHPYVGLSVYYAADGTPLWRCSGTLISSRVYLTAGHCVSSDGVDTPAHAEIWFMEDVGASAHYPFAGSDSVGGTPYGHPQYDNNAFYLHDLGVVLLDKPYRSSEYGALPELGTLDALKAAGELNDATVTAVGYGLQKINPVFVEAFRIRLQATLDIVDINGTAGIPAGTSVMVSGNANTGGTCFGDSGGPQFLNDSNVVVAVTSFGLNGNCAGVGGGYRVDTADDLDWLYSAFGKYLK